MSQHFQTELNNLNERLLTMASKAEIAVNTAIRALVERDDDLALQVEITDTEIDQFEIKVDESAILLLSKAPLARDLRFITVAMKICTDLERVGDEATTIARRSRELNQEPQLKDYIDIPRMAKMAMDMIDQALTAFVNSDAGTAQAVVPKDKAVDQLNKQLHRELSSYMVENPKTISRCLNLMVISKSIERIADHAKNIAEVTVYLCNAKDIRHHGQAAAVNE
ncbi:MAG: Phosphate-specific transport system accessory protein PhoU [Verrucomicrobia subdivision 3 bacterium]|nr:Phosphate-specific transport system accessory protein PhoU [Limisphaerales bacterium]MCS1414746.1 Phosphate-specific transport system accessory protein PhoU [Limisphaerales bacterium]